MKKFKFKLEILKRQRKLEQDIAQKELAEAQKAVRDQMAYINRLYTQIDEARLRADNLISDKKSCVQDLQQIDDFISMQKIKIDSERKKARHLMSVEEQASENLVEKMRAHKALEKLKEKQQEEYHKQVQRKELKIQEDIVTMKFQPKENV